MQDKKGEHPLGDAGQLMLFGLFLITWVLDSFFLQRSTFLAHSIPLVIRLIFLATALLAAFILFKSGHAAVIGEQRPSRIISTGAFGYVRHPLYLGSILVYLGLTVSTASLFCLVLLPVIALFYNYIAGYEEKRMEAKFGQAYIAYRLHTGKWLPRFGKKG
ncbi:MAG: isoprenylcysteine carboxylmethyltransferase family protein [Desulfobacterales bacterium]|nr:isoprenylcysteine carboxylmethyltransferase family protein [Desulfobacterales bacterium]